MVHLVHVYYVYPWLTISVPTFDLLLFFMDNGLLMRTKNYESSNWLAFWAVQSAAQTKSIYVEKNVSNTPPHSGSKLQKPAKIRLKKFGKLTYLLCSCRNLITFEYEVDLNRKGKSIEICRKFVAWNL